MSRWVVLCWVGDGFLACLCTWFWSFSLFKVFDLWLLSDLLRSTYFLASDLPHSRRWSWGYYVVSVRFGCFCTVCGFILFVLCSCFDQRLGDRRRGLVLWWFGFVNPKGSVTKTRKGLVRLTRKSLVTDILDSSLNLSSYVLLARKIFLCLLLFRELLALGF